MWTREDDNSVVDKAGKVIFFSTQRFVNDICLGNCCILCGARPGQKQFNNEHVFPEWLLRHFNLFDKTITLPNGSTLRYDRNTVPCCVDCNSLMGNEIERPISEVVKGGHQALDKFLSTTGNWLKIAVWLALIFLKSHLKDRALRFHLDARKGQEKISDLYDWEHLHHIHTFARAFYNGCFIDPKVIGSVLVA